MMRRNTYRRIVEGLAALALLSGVLTGCQKKCQAPPTEAFSTFVEQDWRIVESNDPQFRSLNNTNFTIMNFGLSFAGALYYVANNEKYDIPFSNFYYNVDPGRKLIRIQYVKPPTEEETQAAGGEAPEGEPIGEAKTYCYSLGREFKLTQSMDGRCDGRGFYYRMVPFQGVVKPDEKCTF